MTFRRTSLGWWWGAPSATPCDQTNTHAKRIKELQEWLEERTPPDP